MKIRFYLSICFLLLLSFYGCGGSAEIERKQAQQAMEEAGRLKAEDLASANFEQAQTSWNHAQAAEKEGKTDAAKVMYTSARIFFGKAADIAKAKRDALTRELGTMQLTISSNLDQVKGDLSTKTLSSRQQNEVSTILSDVEKSNATIASLVKEDDLRKAVAMAKEVQTRLYHAQLILAGKRPEAKNTSGQ